MKNDRRHVVTGAAGRLYCEDRGDSIAALAVDVVVPVPMHWSRRLRRGTNGPEVLAARLSTHTGGLLVDRVVFRQRNTLPQAKLKPKERFRNVRDAFGLRAGYDWSGQSVLLVDDILTTGATCSEVARILKAAGASRVVVAVLARAEGLRTVST